MRWQILYQPPQVVKELGIGEILSILLVNRGVRTPEEQHSFFYPPAPEKITLPELNLDLHQIKTAIEIIQKAIATGDQIVVYGDYDADGICSTAIMWETLNYLGSKAMPYIPDRFTEGYGLKIDSIKSLQNNFPNLKLIITVDQGITAHEAINYCKENGLAVIVTDHHQSSEVKPAADAIIHTTITSGSGVAWWFCHELCNQMQKDFPADKLELAVLGTVADILPLTGVNRSLISFGLKNLRKTQRPGLLSLFNIAQIDSDTLDTYHIGFLIGPRLNAMGRLEHALDSLRLLCTYDKQRAFNLALTLNDINRHRQDLTQEMYQLAMEVVKPQTDNKLLIVEHKDFPEGVIGLIAGKLVETFHKPAIVISTGETISKASARSIKTFDIIFAIRKFDHLLMGGGGHPMAAGFTIDNSQLNEFTKKIISFADQIIKHEDLDPVLEIDVTLEFSQINADLEKEILIFAPFGMSNPQPVFSTNSVTVENKTKIGKTKQHLNLILSKEDIKFKAIAFNKGYLYDKLQLGKTVDVAYQIIENNWQGKCTLELKIRDINIAEVNQNI